MTFNGWLQIVLFAVLVFLLTKPFGSYMTRVFTGQRTLLRPVLRPTEVGIYRICGVSSMQSPRNLHRIATIEEAALF